MKTLRFPGTCLIVGLLYFVALLVSSSNSSPLQSPSGSEIQTMPCVNPRPLCAHTRETSGFYDHCIEQMFQCGEEGFTLGYAKKRFDALDAELKHIGPELTEWLHKTEKCFQAELEIIAKTKSTRVYPNKHSCLDLENEAIKALNMCYNQNAELCSILSNAKEDDKPTLHQDIHSIVQAFRVGGEYYNSSFVDQGIPEIIRKCPGGNHTELAESLTVSKLPVKVLWCAIVRGYGGQLPQISHYVGKLSEALNRPIEQFVYTGVDSKRQCSTIINHDYHIVSWFASPDDPLLSQLDNMEPYAYRDPYMYSRFEVVNNRVRERSQCGDGIRQAGELCDYANNLLGCATNCSTIKLNYKCTTSKLEPSNCTYSPYDAEPVPVLCVLSPRRSQSLPEPEPRLDTLRVSSADEGLKSELSSFSAAASNRTISPLLLICLFLFAILVSWR